MEYRHFGKTGLKVSEITLGTWVFGHGQKVWKEADDNETYRVINHAVEKGINHIVTAKYGNAREVVGKGLRGLRDKIYLGDSAGSKPLTLQDLEKNIDESLQMLQTDYIDFYYLHFPKPGFLQMIENMDKLRQKGKCRYLGVSNFSRAQLEKALEVAPIEFIQSPYNILWKEIQPDMLPFCHERRIAVTTYSSIAQGLLAGKYERQSDIMNSGNKILTMNLLCSEKVLPHTFTVIETVKELADKYGKTPSQIAGRWLLHQREVTTVIVGCRTISQLEDNIGAAGWEMEQDDWNTLDEQARPISKLIDHSQDEMWGNKYYRELQ